MAYIKEKESHQTTDIFTLTKWPEDATLREPITAKFKDVDMCLCTNKEMGIQRNRIREAVQSYFKLRQHYCGDWYAGRSAKDACVESADKLCKFLKNNTKTPCCICEIAGLWPRFMKSSWHFVSKITCIEDCGKKYNSGFYDPYLSLGLLIHGPGFLADIP